MSSASIFRPLPHSYIKDEGVKDELHQQGYAIVDFASEEQITELTALFNQHHKFDKPGMFFSLLSDDLEYRKTVHHQTEEILKSSLERHFEGYNNALSSFVAKAPGGGSSFYLHQDPTFIDESKHSPLHLWCPLIDVGTEQGALCVLPRSHFFSSPFRGGSFEFPFADYSATVKRYMKPVPVNKGQALLLDPRLIHSSLPNNSGFMRPVALCQLFPAEADIVFPWQDKQHPEKGVELIKLDKDFFLKHTNFYDNKDSRPETGESLGYSQLTIPDLSKEAFLDFCEQNGLEELNILPESESNPYMHKEPGQS